MWPNGEWVAGLAATAAVLVAAALGLSAGFVDPVALALVTGATAIALGAALLPPGRSQGGSSTAAVFVLALGLVIGVAHHLVFTPRIAVAAARTPAFQVAVATCAAVLATYAWTSAPRSVRLARFVVLTALLAVIGALVILAAPVPRIDVWHLQQGGALELAAGNNPYAASYPNIYGPRTRFIDPSLLNADGRRITAFPYTPLTLLLDVPGAIVGDVRWSLLAAVLASAWLIRALGRGSTASELAAILVLLQPQGFWVVERAWTEPFSLVTILVAALLIARARGWVMPAAALGVAAASKQYMPLLVTPLWLTVPADRRWPALGVAGVSVAALMLPFLAWHPAGFVRGLVEYQVLQPFRPDALSWPALAVQLGGPVLASWAGLVVGGGGCVSGRRGGGRPPCSHERRDRRFSRGRPHGRRSSCSASRRSATTTGSPSACSARRRPSYPRHPAARTENSGVSQGLTVPVAWPAARGRAASRRPPLAPCPHRPRPPRLYCPAEPPIGA